MSTNKYWEPHICTKEYNERRNWDIKYENKNYGRKVTLHETNNESAFYRNTEQPCKTGRHQKQTSEGTTQEDARRYCSRVRSLIKYLECTSL